MEKLASKEDFASHVHFLPTNQRTHKWWYIKLISTQREHTKLLSNHHPQTDIQSSGKTNIPTLNENTYMFDIWNVIHAHVLHYLVSYGGDILCTVASLGCPAHHQQGGQGPQHLSSPHQGRDGNGKLSRCASDSRRDSPGHKVSADNLQMSPDFHPKKTVLALVGLSLLDLLD